MGNLEKELDLDMRDNDGWIQCVRQCHGLCCFLLVSVSNLFISFCKFATP